LSFFNQISQLNSGRPDLNPLTTGGLSLTVTQPLLAGFGFAVNRRGIHQAQNSLRVQDYVFEQQVMTTVAAVIGLYWDLVSFNEQVKVAEQALATSQKLYDDNKRQVEVGTLAHIAIVQAEAEVASREQDLTVARTNVLQQETIIKNALSKNGVASPSVADAHIVPLDKIRVPEAESLQPLPDLIAKALQARPELPQSRLNIENSKLSILGDKSNMLPSLSAFTTLTNNGQIGTINTLPPLPNNVRAPDQFFIGGYGAYLSQIFQRNFPNYTVGVQLSIPIRNRAAEADYARDTLDMRQSELQLQKQTNQIRVDVQNAVISLQQARVRYQAALKTRVLEEQTLDAEQKKFALGASTSYNVILIQRDLLTALGNEVTAESNYIKARANLDFVTGEILDVNKVDVSEALKGQVARPPTPIPPPAPNGAGAVPNATR
jgi:outer membrane protein TolC